MKNRIYTLFLFAALISCNKPKSIEDYFITKQDEYWAVFSCNSSQFTYYKFNKNKISSIYFRNDKNKFKEDFGEGDVIGPFHEQWSVSNDSIMYWRGHPYDVISFTNEAIVLTQPTFTRPYTEYIYLIKQKENNFLKYPGEIERKRIKNPKKYLEMK